MDSVVNRAKSEQEEVDWSAISIIDVYLIKRILFVVVVANSIFLKRASLNAYMVMAYKSDQGLRDT